MATEQSQRTGGGPRTGGGTLSGVTRWMENLSETGFAYLLLTPALLLLGTIALWPLLSTFRLSLFADSLTGGLGNFAGIQNYVAVLTGQRNALLPAPFLPSSLTVDALFGSALTVTLIFTVVSVFFETIIGFGQALVLNQDFRGRRWVRVAIIIPWAVPIVIQGMLFYLLFQPGIGLFIGREGNPTILQTLGPFSATPLANTVDATLIIIVADIWKTTAFMALLILAGLQSIDRTLYDVARVAGASKWQTFKRITFPLVLPSVLVAMLFRTIQAMRIYGVIETVAGCTTVPSLSCLVISSFNNTLVGTSATIAFITAGIIALVVSVYIFKYAREEMG
ncbi:sugar ABC transporter permease [Haloarculaceae archaeon H-GB1-1]|nr:sugar ABC transporter permease [Haloarculaceae archaeon H-GB1-1]